MRTRSNLRAPDARQAGRKDRHEKRPGAVENTRPSFSVSSYSPISEDQRPCRV